jgi:ribosomal protein L11 methylase PrmA
MNTWRSPASFRDPAGFVFSNDGSLFRQINFCHKEAYDHLFRSGLYDELTNAGLLISHREPQIVPPDPLNAYKIIEPDRVQFISYPYEWCFSQLKSAALVTLEIQRRSLARGMSLKDCSNFNIQFLGQKAILIDTLSIERYREDEPWSAYRQFCEHFLAPLALMSKVDVRLAGMMRNYIDGIPLDLASRLLPFHTRLNTSLLLHIHLHARAQTAYKNVRMDKKTKKVSRLGILGIVDSLQTAVSNLEWQPRDPGWEGYYNNTTYSTSSMTDKKTIVSRYLDQVRPETLWDIGSNRGDFSLIAEAKGARVVAIDSDYGSIERSYKAFSLAQTSKILPLVIARIHHPGWVGRMPNEHHFLIAGQPIRSWL